jgi:hypothetical protein
MSSSRICSWRTSTTLSLQCFYFVPFLIRSLFICGLDCFISSSICFCFSSFVDVSMAWIVLFLSPSFVASFVYVSMAWIVLFLSPSFVFSFVYVSMAWIVLFFLLPLFLFFLPSFMYLWPGLFYFFSFLCFCFSSFFYVSMAWIV